MKASRRTTRGGPGARITGGELGGRVLAVSSATRPSSARLREALASIWSDRVGGARLLDLYAGSGAVGLELLSRGAASALFVECDRSAAAALTSNLALAGSDRTRALAIDAGQALTRLAVEGARFDLIFVDPPYELELDESLFNSLAAVAAPAAQLAVERRARAVLRSGASWQPLGTRRYGDAELHLFELEPPTARAESPSGLP